jgi:hypothetical protein
MGCNTAGRQHEKTQAEAEAGKAVPLDCFIWPYMAVKLSVTSMYSLTPTIAARASPTYSIT